MRWSQVESLQVRRLRHHLNAIKVLGAIHPILAHEFHDRRLRILCTEIAHPHIREPGTGEFPRVVTGFQGVEMLVVGDLFALENFNARFVLDLPDKVGDSDAVRGWDSAAVTGVVSIVAN